MDNSADCEHKKSVKNSIILSPKELALEKGDKGLCIDRDKYSNIIE